MSAGVSSPTRELYFTHTPGQTQYNMRMPLNLGGRNTYSLFREFDVVLNFLETLGLIVVLRVLMD